MHFFDQNEGKHIKKKIARDLPPLDLPQMVGGNNISENDVAAGSGVFVRLLPYQTAATGDFIKVEWDSRVVKEAILQEPNSQFPIVFRITENTGLGEHEIYYSVTDAAGNISYSPIITVHIIEGGGTGEYPPPVFVDAINGIITQDSLEENKGTHVLVYPYKAMKTDDLVTLFWSGFDSENNNINNSVITEGVTIDNLTNGVEFTIPMDKFNGLVGGICTAHYQVMNNGVILGASSEAVASVSSDVVNPSELDMQITTGAVPTDHNAIHVYPFNCGVLKGKPGVAVTLFLAGVDAAFNESGNNTYQTFLDENGLASFKIRAGVTGGVTVTAMETDHAEISISKVINFGRYKSGNGNILYLNYSTGAPNDGATPCSFYLKTAPNARGEITVVRVAVSGNAIIDGYGSKVADVILNADKSAEIDIINTVSENVNVELSLPESSGSINNASISFVAF